MIEPGGELDSNSALMVFINLGVAGIGLLLFIKGVITTGVERDHWRNAYEEERKARTDLERALAVETEKAASAVENAKVTRQLLEEIKAAGRETAS